VLADVASKVGDFHVLGVQCVQVQRHATAKDRNQTCVIGWRQMQHVKKS
jgi:hypothetical protein